MTKKTLHDLAYAGRVQPIVKALKAGADINAKDDIGATPIMYAIAANRQQAFHELEYRGAEMPATYPNGDCVLTRAIRAGFNNMAYFVAQRLPAAIPAARKETSSREMLHLLDVVEFGEKEAKRRWKEDHPSAARTKPQGSEITQVINALSQPKN